MICDLVVGPTCRSCKTGTQFPEGFTVVAVAKPPVAKPLAPGAGP